MFNSYFPESQRFYLTSAYAHISWRLFFKQVNTANQYFSSCLLGVISYRHRSYKVICDSLEATGLDCSCCLCVKCNLHVGDSSFSSGNHHHFFLRASSAVSNVWTVSQCQHTKGTLRTSNAVYLRESQLNATEEHSTQMISTEIQVGVCLVLLLFGLQLLSWLVFPVNTVTSRQHMHSTACT